MRPSFSADAMQAEQSTGNRVIESNHTRFYLPEGTVGLMATDFEVVRGRVVT
jgi:hypothetical protein